MNSPRVATQPFNGTPYPAIPSRRHPHNLDDVNLLRRRRADDTASDAGNDTTDSVPDLVVDGDGTVRSGRADTPGKGKPTPKRRDAQGRRRGPVAPAPLTAKEARARRKAQRGTRADRKQAATDRRQSAAERRRLMMAGDERYLLPKDKGPVKAYVRDIVDARRNFAGLFMPLALGMVGMMFVGVPAMQYLITLAMLIMMLFMVIEGLLLGRMVNKRVRERFPDHTDRPLSLGFYAFMRASQMRNMRAPKPRVKPGQAI
ncbi:MAG: DUF3043 domain-containing protein [Mycobacteriaceae bacterium]|nr:DUF3043 domain-containing protein [Mycobacteriaceae bacterium]